MCYILFLLGMKNEQAGDACNTGGSKNGDEDALNSTVSVERHLAVGVGTTSDHM